MITRRRLALSAPLRAATSRGELEIRCAFTDLLLPLALVVACQACDGDDRASQASGAVTFALMPLVEGAPVAGATFDLRIDTIDAQGNATPHVVQTDLTTGSAGALTWVGTCRSGADGEPGLGVATVTLKSIELGDGVSTFGAQLPMTQVKPFLCNQGGDTPIDFEFEVVLQLERGFTDVRVQIDQIECAAKFDCVQDLLPRADGSHGPTFVTGLSCRGVDPGVPLDNLLSFTRQLRCYDEAGNLLARGVAPLIDNARSYTGFELAPTIGGTGSAYWNTATLLDEAAIGGVDHCRLEAFAFVRSQAVGGPRPAAARTGSKAIRWDVEVRLDGGALACEGTVGAAPIGLRIDDAPTPGDSRFSPDEAPVTQTTTAIVDGLRDPGCDAPRAAWQEALVVRSDAAAALARFEAADALVATLAAVLDLLGDADEPATVAGALALAHSLHDDVGFDASRVAASLDVAAATLQAAAALLDPIDGVPTSLRDGIAAQGQTIAALRADAQAGAYFALAYDAAEDALRAVTQACAAELDAARAARDALGDATRLHADVTTASAAVERSDAEYTQCLISDAGPTPALRVWGARDVIFPLPADGVTGSPAQDELLWVSSRLGAPSAVTFESACTPEPGRALIFVGLRDPALDGPGQRAAILLLRLGTGNWVCSKQPDGSCSTYDLNAVSCTPETP